MTADRVPDAHVTIRPVLDGLWQIELARRWPERLSANVWVFAETDGGCTLIDAGLPGPEQTALWRSQILPQLPGPVVRVICTHHHPDHTGQLHLLCNELGAELWMSRPAWFALQDLGATPSPEQGIRLTDYLRRHAVASADTESYFTRFMTRTPLSLPPFCRQIAEGDRLRFGNCLWMAWVGNGHAPGALILSGDDKLAIVGDEILALTTPHVGHIGMDAGDDPLSDYLSLLDRGKIMNPDALVLPGHGSAFLDPSSRSQAIHRHHEGELARILEQLDRPRTTADIARFLFGHRDHAVHNVLAVTEAHAHLNHLWLKRDLLRDTGNELFYWHRSQTG